VSCSLSLLSDKAFHSHRQHHTTFSKVYDFYFTFEKLVILSYIFLKIFDTKCRRKKLEPT